MTIEIFINDYGAITKLGSLRRHAGSTRERVTYEHDKAWLKSPSAFQFDPTLPLRSGTFHPGKGKEMFGTLGDSAPDTWGRGLMRRRERRDADREGRPVRTLHEADYLLGVSDYTRLGGIRFCMDGVFQSQQEKGVPSTHALGDLVKAAQRIERGDETDEDLMMIFAPGSSLGGARPKASIFDQFGNLSIAKFPKETDTYSIERWEAIALDMAAAANIEVSSYDLVEVNQKPVFLSKRFDRLHNNADQDNRIPFMSAMAATEHSDGDDTCSYLELVDIINELGAEPEKDRSELFRRIAFSILITNTDDHFRNHGFLWSGRKGWRLSPLYDVNPVANSPRILSTRIDFDDASASIELLLSVAEYFLTAELAKKIIEECRAIVLRWREFARARGAPDSEIKLMRTAFEHEEQ